MDVEIIFAGFSGLREQDHSNNKNNNYPAGILRASGKANKRSGVHSAVPK
jgi:hypothetical protein